MSGFWTTDQVLALATNTNTIKNSRGLAHIKYWPILGRNHQVVWGICQGSDKYQVKASIEEATFDCSCPSPQIPCKHIIGMLLLLADNPQYFPECDAPEWVAKWLDNLIRKAAKKAEKLAQASAKPVDKEAQARRIAAREKKIALGLVELDLWLTDLIRQGLSSTVGKSYDYWDTMAARLVDAQASGLARRVRELAGVASSGAGWQERLLEKLGQIYLLARSYQNLAQAPAGLQADIRSLIGWNQSQDELLLANGLRDHWLVLGQIIEEDPLALNPIKVQRVWLFGRESQRYAMLLNFAVFMQPLERSYSFGECFDGELAFFPSAFPLRAIIKERSKFDLEQNYSFLLRHKNIAAAMAAFAEIIIEYPWFGRLPMVIADIVPLHLRDYPTGQKEHFILQDEEGHYLPLSKEFQMQWQLIAQSGGHPITIFGEWNGESFLPIAVLK